MDFFKDESGCFSEEDIRKILFYYMITNSHIFSKTMPDEMVYFVGGRKVFNGAKDTLKIKIGSFDDVFADLIEKGGFFGQDVEYRFSCMNDKRNASIILLNESERGLNKKERSVAGFYKKCLDDEVYREFIEEIPFEIERVQEKDFLEEFKSLKGFISFGKRISSFHEKLLYGNDLEKIAHEIYDPSFGKFS